MCLLHKSVLFHRSSGESCSTSGVVSCLLEIKFRVSTGRVSQHRLPCPFLLCVHREADRRKPPGRTELRLLGLSLRAYVNITVRSVLPSRLYGALSGGASTEPLQVWLVYLCKSPPAKFLHPHFHTHLSQLSLNRG